MAGSTDRENVVRAATLVAFAVSDAARRQAGIVACSQARTRAEAAQFLNMLGLDVAPPTASEARTPPPPSPTRPGRPARPTPQLALAATLPAHEPDGALTRSDTDAIRRRWTTGATTVPQLATDYRVRPTAITNAIQYGTWTQGAPVTGTCVDCDRAMVTQPAYRRDDRWRDAGFARAAARGRCNGCYGSWRARNQPNQDTPPRFSAGMVRVTPLYPVLCGECGLIGDAPDTRAAAQQLREQHIQSHLQDTQAGQPPAELAVDDQALVGRRRIA